MALDLDIERVAMLKEVMPKSSSSALCVLILLLKHRGQIVTNQRMSEEYRQMQGGVSGLTTDAIRTYIRRARVAVSVVGWPVEIKNFYGLGYQLVAPKDWDWRNACAQTRRSA